MDNRPPPDSNVVRLRRNGDPSEAERKKLASTIFAEQDDVGPFSCGNLVPPAPTPPPAEEPSPEADPFFEQFQASPTTADEQSVTATSEDATAAYFLKLGAQTPVEMSQSITPQPVAIALPGSASLPGDLRTQRRQRRRSRSARSPSVRWPTFPRLRIAAPPLVAAVGALLVAGAALAAIVGNGANRPSSKARPAGQHASPPATLETPSLLAHVTVAGASSSLRHRRAISSAHHASRRYDERKPRIILAADRRATNVVSHPAATAPVQQAAPQTVVTTQVVQQPATQAPSTTQASGANSAGTSRPAFGANGTLGPGHSPNG
jgi:hypothetical protein